MSNSCKDCTCYASVTGANLFGSCTYGGLTLPTMPVEGCSVFTPKAKAVHKEKELFRFALIRRLNELDKSQTWLARQLSTDPANISLYASGKRVPRANTFLRICEVLDIDPKEVRFE